MLSEKQDYGPEEAHRLPLILAIETSTALLGVSVVAGREVLFQRCLVKPRAHSIMLLPMCLEALASSGARMADLSAVAVSAGPGSFTGLRIGFATAQGLAKARRASVVLVPTFEVLLEQCASYPRVAVVQGRARAQTVTALFANSGAGFREVIPPAARGMEEFLRDIREASPGTVHVTGDAAVDFVTYCQSHAGFAPGVQLVAVTEEQRLPSPAVVGLIGSRMLEEGKVVKPEEALPRYYRKSSPEVLTAGKGPTEKGGRTALDNAIEMQIEKMTVNDLDRVLEIEAVSYRTPWTRRAFTSEITENSYAHYFVARHQGKIIGYVGMWVILEESHITNIAVDPAYRRRKVAQRLLEDTFRRARELGATRITLEVRASNSSAQDLYTKMGFVNRGLRKGYYTDTNEDAVVMWKDAFGPRQPKEDQVKWMV
jgi:ribosomal-protein-alanine N-acetyltransferase